MTVHTPALRLRIRAAALALSAAAVISVAACNAEVVTDPTISPTESPAPSTVAGTASIGTVPNVQMTDQVGTAASRYPRSGSVGVTVTTTSTSTATETAAPTRPDGAADAGDQPLVNTLTVAQSAAGDGGNAHVINTAAAVTFDPNVIIDPVDRNAPGKVATAYLLARLGCDSNSISLADCLGRAADLSEATFGRLLTKKAQDADGWRQQVLDTRLIVTVRVDDIAVQPIGNGYQVTLAYTRTVSSAVVEEQASPGVTTVTVEPSDTVGWWVTGDSGFGAG